MQPENDSIEKLGKLIEGIHIAMLTTVSADGSLRSRPMATQQVEFDGDLWFFTREDSGKTQEVRHEAHVNLSYADPGNSRFVSVSGVAAVVKDPAKAKELWSPLYTAWFPKGLDDPELSLLMVRVRDAEYWDAPSGKMIQLAKIVKAAAMGTAFQPEPGAHAKLSLS